MLGSGVSGVVRLVTHKASGVKYAVKCLDLGLIKSEEGLDQLRSEIYIMCQLDHPHIVRLEEVYEGLSEIYLVMELCIGGDLFDRLDEQPDYHYTEAQCARLVKQMLSSVRYLHSKNIIHRDLKLENFLFSDTASESVLKMIDFGLSKHFTFGETHHEAVGTPYTVAPEIITGSYNEKGDIWAIGVITYLLLSGETPFGGVDGEDLMEVRSNILRGSIKFEPADIWEHVSDVARDFVLSCLKKEPESRPSAKQAQRHPWIQTYGKKDNSEIGQKLNPNVVNALVSFKEYSDMRKLLCEVLSFTLLPEQIKDLREEFEKMDNGDGEISLADLKKVLLESAESRSLGGMTEKEVEDVFNALRVRKTETKIRWHEFIAAGLSQCEVDERNLKLAFDRLDTERKGYINFKDVMDLIEGSDVCENRDDLELMWKESIQHVKGDLDQITVDDFLLLMKGQALGEQTTPFRDHRRAPPLGAVPEGQVSPIAARPVTPEIADFKQSHLIPKLEEGVEQPDTVHGLDVRAEELKGDEKEGVDRRKQYFRLRSRSLEHHNKSSFFDDEDDDSNNSPRPSLLLPSKSKRNIENVIEDGSKTPLVVNRALYRAHREMRLAVLEASKRFEEKRKLRERLASKAAGTPGASLVMRRGDTAQVTFSNSSTSSMEMVKPIESKTKARGRNRRKTVSDMTGMLQAS